MKILIPLFFLPIAASANCPDFSGRYQVDKDVTYGDSYRIEFSQVGCSSIAQIGGIASPITVLTDGKMKTSTYSDGSSMSAIYRLTPTTFHAIEIRMNKTGEFDDSTESVVSKNGDGSLTIERRDTDKNGFLKIRLNQARKLP